MLFPEKRSFFLEGAGVFSFASTGPEPAGGIPPTGADVYPFFSRQIGLLRGEEVPIDAGLKLTGTVGRTDVGVLGVRTGDLRRPDDVLIVDEKNFFVGRVKRNLLPAVVRRRDLHGRRSGAGQSGQTYGADMRLATSRFLGRASNLVVNAYGARSVNEGVPGRDWSYGFSAHYPNDRFDAQVAFREMQENFKPALGFVQRDNVRMLRVAGSYNPRPKNFLNIQQMFHDVYYTRFTRAGQRRGRELGPVRHAARLALQVRRQSSTRCSTSTRPTSGSSSRSRSRRACVLPPGEYRFTRFRSNLLATATKRRLSGSVNLTFGNYWSGKRRAGDDEPHLQASAAVHHQREHEPDVRAAAGRRLHRAHRHVEHQLRGVPVAVVLEPDPVRQPVEESGLAEPRALDAAARQRPVLRVQPGLDPGSEERGNLRFRAQDSKLSAKFQYSFRF